MATEINLPGVAQGVGSVGRGAFTGSGVILIDKPRGCTSFDVVRTFRRQSGARKVGHCGTLDPLATGVLPLCVNEATKIAGLLSGQDKAYEGSARLGISTDTYDITGEVTAVHDGASASRVAVEAEMGRLCGPLAQVPPRYSAVRIAGRRACDRVRAGEAVQLASRSVTVFEFCLTGFQRPTFDFRVRCSKGTYVRSLVHDLGQGLGCGATLTRLRRTGCGPFAVSDCLSLSALETPNALQLFETRRGPGLSWWRTIDEALANWPCVQADASQAARIRQGQSMRSTLPDQPQVRIHGPGGLIALGCVADGQLRANRVFVRRV